MSHLADNHDPFRQHIDRLLASYVQAHLIKNHCEYTSRVVQLVSSSEIYGHSSCCMYLHKQLRPYFLKQVPLVDPSAFTLPVDPFDNLFPLTSIDQVALHEERFRVDKDATRVIKQHLQTRPGTLKTDRIASGDGCMISLHTYMRLSMLTNSFRPTDRTSGAILACFHAPFSSSMAIFEEVSCFDFAVYFLR